MQRFPPLLQQQLHLCLTITVQRLHQQSTPSLTLGQLSWSPVTSHCSRRCHDENRNWLDGSWKEEENKMNDVNETKVHYNFCQLADHINSVTICYFGSDEESFVFVVYNNIIYIIISCPQQYQIHVVLFFTLWHFYLQCFDWLIFVVWPEGFGLCSLFKTL